MAPYMNHFIFLQTIFIFYFLFRFPCSESSLSLDEECSALYQFKQSIIHQDDEFCVASWFQTFHSWKPTSNASNARFDCCSWYGVECSSENEHGHVVGLDFSESSLCGHTNSSTTLLSLVHLQSLNLAMNDFGGSRISSEIAHLKQLRSLNLSNSGFSGEISNEISHLMQMSSLDLSMNPLKLHSPGCLKNLVQHLTKLEELDLSSVDISSSVPHFLANFSFLMSIMLWNCSLPNEFPTAILELPKLKLLDLAFNVNLIGSFPDFRNKSLLEHVDLKETCFFGIVSESISNLRHLMYLCLTDCSFSGRIPGSLSNLTQLAFLALSSNKFTRFEMGRLPNWLGKLTELSKLGPNDMNIDGKLPPFLPNLTKLSVLEMGRNSFNGHIPSTLFNLTQLTSLNLEQNHLQGPISNSFSNFKSLWYLKLLDNNINGSVHLDMFLGLNKLQILDLGNNMISLVVNNNYTNSTLPELNYLDLSTCNLKEFPAFLRFQNKLENLFLAHNKIDGMVPTWIWNNSKETLEMIDLCNNSIIGFHQHPHFLPWRCLKAIDIRHNQVRGQLPIPPKTTVIYAASYNNMIGEIPPLICEVKSLRMLILASNNMSGTIPPCFSNLSNSLLLLDLSGNNFHGVLMNVFMNGSLLRYIDLKENQFTGQLPRSLINCTDLEFLSLGDKSFDDDFPSWLGNLPNLQVLMLRFNNFYGPIECLTNVCSQFPKLWVIDLSNNGFSGQLPRKYFQTWNAIRLANGGESFVMVSQIIFKSFTATVTYTMSITHKGVRTGYGKILTKYTPIDLSCNHFEGEIPESLQDLLGLESLNLSNNHFTGHVLQSLGHLKNLESLDLSRNELYGEIPQQLVELNFLSIFNVSFNHLNWRIPQGQQFSTFDYDSYVGNPGLCGKPLSNECQHTKGSTLLPSSSTSESLLPSEKIDWIIVFCGVGSGLVIGVVIRIILYESYTDRFTKRKERFLRSLRNTRRNKGTLICYITLKLLHTKSLRQ